MRPRSLLMMAILVLAIPVLAACAVAQSLISPTSAPDDAYVKIQFGEEAQVELTNPQGRRVLVDVHSPHRLSSPPTENDVLLVSHEHDDHYNWSFGNAFPGPKLMFDVGEIALPDVQVVSLAAAHGDWEEPTSGSNHIFIIDMGGMRIAHFGDTGQKRLLPEQLDALGEVDIAVTWVATWWAYENFEDARTRPYTLMAQVNPRLIIATHGTNDSEAIERATEVWDVYYTETNPVTIHKADLPDDPSARTKLLIMGEIAFTYSKLNELPEWQGEPVQ